MAKSQPTQGAPETGDNCRKLEIDTESDFEMFSASSTFSDILANLNLVEGVYANFYDMDFIVIYQHECSTVADPYPTTESGCGGFSTLQQFGAEWRTNFTNIRRDITVLYSRKEINVNKIGCEWIGVFGNGSENDGVVDGVCTTFRPYSVNQLIKWDLVDGTRELKAWLLAAQFDPRAATREGHMALSKPLDASVLDFISS